ncbi:MAG: glycoside hydrolase family 3 N-terminal domain-containing protein, partial [Candidatus Nanopelagicales bacterium]
MWTTQDFKFGAACSLVAGLSVAALAVPMSASADSTNAHVSTVEAVLPVIERTAGADDPTQWGNRKLAARLMLVGASNNNLPGSTSAVRAGAAGIVLFGAPPRTLARQLKALRAAAPGGRLLVSSDEEGGMVQRLARLVGKMPTAKRIGQTKTPAQTRAYAFKYGKRLKALGVGTNLAPVADLKYSGSWTDRDGRAFKAAPTANGKYVTAFARGMQAAGVMATVKHWPGGGAVVDTHKSAGSTPPWSTLQQRDLVPFRAAFAAGVGAVMISHAKVPGL